MSTETSFLPPRVSARRWETRIERIQVVIFRCRDKERLLLIRLRGRSRNLSLHLAPPRDGHEATLKVTLDEPPEDHEVLFEYRATELRFFADAYFYIHQQGLDRWILTSKIESCAWWM